MNENIKVSVVIPIYNVLPYLRTCLDSLTAQTIQESEFIMVSDGASEEECSICNEYVAKDSRFKFFRREHATDRLSKYLARFGLKFKNL